ncbi:hypothetical protein HDA32_004469 [Spinactinospora alkalitolerans]|uniref:DUF8017 domain-containing protein n=2 Tax=Spinactinospora alkalitolerans TaxID=687207 RepID=A0A852TZD0_9ACTN|nr:hypothetical protein [Spinactinospora alkalitolerans]NYE49349.1 hypothetical protein [Spinactinospora alkalitolerans]
MMVALLAIVFAAVLVIAVTVVVISLRGNAQQAAAPAAPAEESSEPEPEPAGEPEPTQEPSSPPPPVPLMQEGWQLASVTKWGFVYEIPPSDDGWVFDGPTHLRGYEDDDGQPVLGMGGTSLYKENPCETWGSRADVGAQAVTDTDDTEEMARNVALKWAEYAFETEAGGRAATSVRSVEAFSSNDLTGHHAVIDATVQQPDADCQPPGGVVHAVAVPADQDDTGVRVFLVIADTGVDDALTEETIDTVISTLRDNDYDYGDQPA